MSKDTFLSALEDRLKGSVTGPASVIWLLLNWQIPVILVVGKGDGQDRISSILESYAPSGSLDWWHLIVMPAILTFVYVMAVPLLREGAFYWTEMSERRKARARIDHAHAIEDHKRMAVEQTIVLGALRTEFENIGKTWTEAERLLRELRTGSRVGDEDSFNMRLVKFNEVMRRAELWESNLTKAGYFDRSHQGLESSHYAQLLIERFMRASSKNPKVMDQVVHMEHDYGMSDVSPRAAPPAGRVSGPGSA